MNMLSGIYYPRQVQTLVDGREVTIRDPKDAFACGIGIIHQHLKLVDVFPAAENMVLGLPGGASLDRRAINERVREISQHYGFSIDPNQKVYEMTVSKNRPWRSSRCCIGAPAS